jgi:hypothetical protein
VFSALCARKSHDQYATLHTTSFGANDALGVIGVPLAELAADNRRAADGTVKVTKKYQLQGKLHTGLRLYASVCIAL